MKNRIHTIGACLLCSYLIVSLFACSGEHRTVSFDDGEEITEETENESGTPIEREEEKTFQPGDFTVVTTGGLPFDEYEETFGVTVKNVSPVLSEEEVDTLYRELNDRYPEGPVPEEESDALAEKIDALASERTLSAFDAFRTGEADLLVLDDPFLFHLLAHEGAAEPLDEAIGDLAESGEYYEGIINAGRVGGVLYGVMPFCRIEGILVPKGAWDTCGERAGSAEELSALYDLLEQEKRSGTVAAAPFLFHEIACSWDDGAGAFSFSGERLAGWFDLFSEMEESAKNYTASPSTPELFRTGETVGIRNPAMLSLIFSDGESPAHDYPAISEWGREAVLIPYPGDREGFDLFGQVVLISAKSERKEACAAFLRWLLSPAVQKRQAPSFSGLAGREYASPVLISAARDLAETIKDDIPPYVRELYENDGGTAPDGKAIADYNEELFSRAVRFGKTSSDWFTGENDLLRFILSLASGENRRAAGETPEEIADTFSREVGAAFSIRGFFKNAVS